MWRHRKARTSKELDPQEMAALVQAAHVSEDEIRGWHGDFLRRYPSGRLTKQAFAEYGRKFCPDCKSQTAFEQMFQSIDTNNDGTIDFNELLLVIVLMSRMNKLETRLAFALNMWDTSGDGQIDQNELADVISAIYDRAGVGDRKGDRDPKKRAKEIIDKLDISGDKKLSKQEFIEGCKNDPVIRNLLAPDA